MEAKDTVITCEYDCPDANTSNCYYCDYGTAFEAGCKAQAEISFKAGEKLTLEKQGQAYLEGKQSGIKEVVEWLRKDCACFQPDEDGSYVIPGWQAKLKEWAGG